MPKRYPIVFASGGPRKEAESMQNIITRFEYLEYFPDPIYRGRQIRHLTYSYALTKKMLFLKQSLTGKMFTLDEMVELVEIGAFENTWHDGSFVFDTHRIIIYDDFIE